MDRGTLFHLKNLLHRTSISDDPGKNMKACEDFLYIILCAHIITAADEVEEYEGNSEGSMTVQYVSECIVNKFVNFLTIKNHVDTEDGVTLSHDESELFESNNEGVNLEENSSDENGSDDETTQRKNPICDDEVHEYAQEVLSLGLIWHSYHDAVREGDGDRVFVIWKYLLLIFLNTKRTNYTKEVLIQLLQCKYLFSERKVAQLKWDRFVNTQGRLGCNVAADLHMEHLNKRFKGILRNLGSNIQPYSIVRASKSIGIVHNVSSAFESGIEDMKESGKHGAPTMEKDVEKVVTLLKEIKVFQKREKRCHSSLRFLKGLLASINRKDTKSRLTEKVFNAIGYI